MPRWRTPPAKRRRARDLRKQATPAEQRAWLILRRRQIGGLKFRRQHLIAGFIVDFYCAELRLALELDGGVHEDQARREYDEARTRVLERYGVRVLRIGNEEVSEARLRALILPLQSPAPAVRERGQG
jgi:very-short-patch-repair endonuclease